MGWCPECKVEYVEGIVSCADCGCTLVEELPEDKPEPVFPEGLMQEELIPEEFLPEELMAELAAGEEISGDEAAGEELREKIREVAAQKMADKMRSQAAGFYRNNDEKAQEHRSSAYTLLLVGGVGMVAIVLFFLDLLPISMAPFSKYMITGVMGVMFILFLVMGFVSMKNSKVLEGKAGKENNLTKEIKSWCFENIKADKLDELLFQSEESAEYSEEIKYFKRFDKMKEILENQFVNLEAGYLERLIDEVYSELFEDKEI